MELWANERWIDFVSNVAMVKLTTIVNEPIGGFTLSKEHLRVPKYSTGTQCALQALVLSQTLPYR
tara:strand:- start:39 stop:233 length:195 start_codon:yes stop_codon:yes gene_type:complete